MNTLVLPPPPSLRIAEDTLKTNAATIISKIQDENTMKWKALKKKNKEKMANAREKKKGEGEGRNKRKEREEKKKERNK
jgi:hypothetical protein